MNTDKKWPGGTVGGGVPAFNKANRDHVEASNAEHEEAEDRLNAKLRALAEALRRMTQR